MSKKLSTCTHKFLKSDAIYLSPKAIEEIRNAQNNIPDTQHIMYKKHHIEAITYQKIIDNQRPSEPTKKCAEHNTSSTSIQKDGVIYTEHPRDDEDSANFYIRLNTVTSKQKDKVSQKKKASTKAKDKSSLVEKNRIINSSKDDTSR
ncbi:15640_t:CDS:2 [Cetraspora pellucida]|uniref:15640_t:CDS:1 n=1 Tax=Cetraspora pellucida TaxID=1433469 RepID=A0A9N9NEJ3_9GLOM|nr:15640_t:CDS:2 [Cetraspora pellucida]